MKTTPKAAALTLVLTLLLVACGSKPVPQPATVVTARSAMGKAMQAYDDNRYVEARSFFGKALMEYQSVDNRPAEAETLTDLADCALLQGDVPAARDSLAGAATLAGESELAGLKPRLALLTAYAALQSGDAAGAAAGLDGLLNDKTTPADIRGAALFARTQAAYDLKASDAGQWLVQLASVADKDARATARLERLQALAARGAGDTTKAAALYTDALARYQGAYYRPGIAASHEEWADMLLAAQDWNGARDHLRRALTVRLWMYDATHSVRILENMQKADTALNDGAAAKQDAEWADYLRNGGDPSQAPAPPRQPLSP